MRYDVCDRGSRIDRSLEEAAVAAKSERTMT